MGWNDDWSGANYVFTPGDVRVIYEAIKERVNLFIPSYDPLFNFVPGQSQLIDLDNRFPLGIDALHDPQTPGHPEYIPAHYQNDKLWKNLQQAVEQLAAYPGDVGTDYPVAVDLSAGDKIHNAIYAPSGSFYGLDCIFSSTQGYIHPTLFQTVGKLKHAAGIPTSAGVPWQEDHWRRRRPRQVLNLNDAFDLYSNPAVNGQRAWEVKNPGGFALYNLPQSGRLMQYNSTSGKWEFCGQAAGEMPDLCDSALALPNHLAPGTHWEGDYIGAWLLDEMKQCLKQLYAWGWFGIGWTGSKIKYGNGTSTASLADAKANALAMFATVDVDTFNQPPFKETALLIGRSLFGDVYNYGASTNVNRAKMTTAFNAAKKREIKWYFATTKSNADFSTAVYDPDSDPYEDHKFKLVYTDTATNRVDFGTRGVVTPTFFGSTTPNPWPVDPATPPPGEILQTFNSYRAYAPIAVANYRGELVYK